MGGKFRVNNARTSASAFMSQDTVFDFCRFSVKFLGVQTVKVPKIFEVFPTSVGQNLEHVKDTDGLMGTKFQEFTADVTSHGVLSLGMSCLEGGATGGHFHHASTGPFYNCKPTNPTQKISQFGTRLDFHHFFLTAEKMQ